MPTVTPDYLVIGHVTKDLQPGGAAPRAGGTANYSALAAQRLGLQAAIVTALAHEDDHLLDGARSDGVWTHVLPSLHTTTFRNVYDPQGHRTQTLLARASDIAFADIPHGWRGAPVVHLGPVAQELPPNLATMFPNRLLGITPQGWMRSWDNTGHVRQGALPVSPALGALPTCAVIVLSIEDLGFDTAALREYALLAGTLVVTQGAGDALVYRQGQLVGSVPALKTTPVDLTGAGDVFATTFLAYYHKTFDPIESAQAAHTAAAQAIAGGTGDR